MKRENVFENDAPTLEMETQTLRPSQQGQQVPFVNGIPVNPYTGTPNPLTTPYQQQTGFVNFNGVNPQQISANQINPQFTQQNPIQQQPYAYANPYMQPVMAGITPGYIGNAFPTPYLTNQHPGMLPNPYFQIPQNQFGTPYTHPMQAQLSGLPVLQPQLGYNPLQQPTPYFQTPGNIAEGQYTRLPNQLLQGATRNGTNLKNGERDFISWFPTVNILETDRSFKLEICVPGVARENCRIHVDKNNILRITGTRRWNQETDAVGFTKKEFNYGSFECSYFLTDNLQKEKISSSCRNGLLIVSIPKKDVDEGEERSFSEISVN